MYRSTPSTQTSPSKLQTVRNPAIFKEYQLDPLTNCTDTHFHRQPNGTGGTGQPKSDIDIGLRMSAIFCDFSTPPGFDIMDDQLSKN